MTQYPKIEMVPDLSMVEGDPVFVPFRELLQAELPGDPNPTIEYRRDGHDQIVTVTIPYRFMVR